MYAKINWFDETIEFISDKEADRLAHPKTRYKVAEEWFPEIDSAEVTYKSPEEAMDELIAFFPEDVANAVLDDSDWEDPHLDNVDNWTDAVEMYCKHPEWMREYLAAHVKEWCLPARAEDDFELVEVPSSVKTPA